MFPVHKLAGSHLCLFQKVFLSLFPLFVIDVLTLLSVEANNGGASNPARRSYTLSKKVEGSNNDSDNDDKANGNEFQDARQTFVSTFLVCRGSFLGRVDAFFIDTTIAGHLAHDNNSRNANSATNVVPRE